MIISHRLESVCKQQIMCDISNKVQCKNYALFKMKIELEKYLCILPSRERIALTKFRCRNTKLPVAITYINNDVSCKLCSQNVDGDEYHYLMECDHFNGERKCYLARSVYPHPSVYKYNKVMNYQNQKKLSQLAKFVIVIIERLTEA